MNQTSTLRPRRAPEAGWHFVDREEEIQLIKDKVADGIAGKQMQSVVTCFWGAFGMGKSWLLLELEHRYKHDGLLDPESSPTIAARLDLNREMAPALWQGNHLNREQLTREIWKQLATQLGSSVPDLGRASPDEWADALVKEVTIWSARYATPLIMLDTVDDLLAQDESTFFWLEQHLVEPLAMTDRVLFVFTSRGELRRWRRFQVRRRVELHRLRAFDAEAAAQEVGAKPEVGKVLLQHAFGHPLITDRIRTVLEDRGIDLETAQQVEETIEPSLMRGILGDVTGEILRAVPELPSKLARYVSILRWVSVEPLRFLAEKMSLIESGHGDAFYLDLIGELQAHHLLYWSSERNTYEPDSVLRRLMAYFLELDDPGRFAAAHLAAFDFHRDHLDRYPQYLARYVPELAYHRAMLSHCEALESQPRTFQTWWGDFLAKKAPTQPEPWIELLEALERDKEPGDALPAEDYERLHSEAEKRAVDHGD